jgi:cystathionine beta-lyase/cystathionine gamma-synthase
MGAILGNSKKKINNIRGHISIYGLHVSPNDCWLVSQAVDTLELRIKELSELTNNILKYLNNNKSINRINYPLLESHPTYQIANKYFNKYDDDVLAPAIIFFHVTIDKELLTKLINECQHILYSTSYGKSHTMINPYIITGDSTFYDTYPDIMNMKKVTGCWIRLAIGCSSKYEDIIKDLDYILNTVKSDNN